MCRDRGNRLLFSFGDQQQCQGVDVKSVPCEERNFSLHLNTSIKRFAEGSRKERARACMDACVRARTVR